MHLRAGLASGQTGSLCATLASVLFLSGCCHAAAAQEQSILEGTVRDQRTGQPLPDAEVTVLDTGVETRTSRWGAYRLNCGTAKEVNIRLLLSGYATVVDRVSLNSARTIADFKMSRVDAILDTYLVADRSPSKFENEGGVAVRHVDFEELQGRDAGDVLKSIPGALVLRPSGQVGSGMRIQLRGLRSLFSGSEPLVYVDGVRTTTSPAHMPWLGSLSAFDLVSPEHIERIEVFKGPAASARFGTGALAGVILIYTKKGPAQEPR